MRSTFRACIGLLLAGLSASGCAAIGAVSYMVTPPPTQPAEYKPQAQPTLVLVENFQNPALFEVPAERLSRDIADQLRENKVKQVIDAQKLFDLKADKGDALRRMDIPAVAKAVGAKQVIYVDLVQFEVDPAVGSDRITGHAEAHVKVVDADTGRMLWPRDSSAGRDVRYSTTNETDPDTVRSIVEEHLYQQLADKVARLFYDAPLDSIDGGEQQQQ